MANGNGSVPQQGPTDDSQDEVWPGSGILPSWNPNGVLGGVADMHPPVNTLDAIMTPDEQKTIAPLDGEAGGIDGMPDLRPPSWGSNGDAPATSFGDGSAPDLDHPSVAQPPGDNSGNGQVSGPHTPVGPVPGYPENGKGSWRAGLDDQISAGANQFNADHGYQPGDPLYITPQTLKSWIMQESGGSRKAFETDPLRPIIPVTGTMQKAMSG
jgi:hypothetical protein